MADQPAMTDTRTRVSEQMDIGNECFATGQLRAALVHYERAIELLTPDLDDMAPPLFENIALARMKMGRYHAAIRAFHRALDGHPTSREQSLRFLILCLLQVGKRHDAVRTLDGYEQAFGEHPEPAVRAGCGR